MCVRGVFLFARIALQSSLTIEQNLMLKLFDYRWLAVVMLLTAAALPVRTHAQTPSVVFSEIAWAGSSISASDEWIELTNVSNATIDLSGWTLTGAGSSGAVLSLPEGASIEPQSTYLIANYELAHENTALAAEPDFVTATLSLSNGGFDLRLLDDGGASIDVAGGAGDPFAGGSGGTASAADGRYTSMVRTSGLSDGAIPESWADANSSQGFLEGVTDLGTPGVVAFATVEPEAIEEIVDEEPVEEPLVEETVEEVVEETVEEAAEEATDETVSTSMRISEFVVDPNEGEEEWIELMNATDVAVDLTGWTIEDAVGKQTVLEGTVAPGEYVLITAPLGKLNNDTDSITLKDSTGTAVDVVEYGTDELATPKDGAALARNESGVFELTYQTTPESVNIIDPEKPEVVEEVETEVVVEETNNPTATNIRINEFVVDPAGDGVEWIELYNADDTEVTLEGWAIEDASGKATDLSTVTIEADAYALIESPKGKLNNDGDTVVLKDASGSIIESVTYGSDGYPTPKDGEALARNGEVFEITELPTPGTANLIFVAIDEVEETTPPVIPTTIVVEEESPNEETEELGDPSVDEELLQDDNGAKTLRFITLYPNTTGSDETEEYIELQNTGTQTINLQGWIIEDGSTDRYTFNDSTLLEAGATVRLLRPQTKITLNNTGDTLELIAPDEEVVDKVTYGNSAKGATYTFVNNAWKWSGAATVAESTTTTTSTATSATSVSNTTNASNTSNATYASSASSRVAQSVTVAQAKEKADGQKVMIRGMVTVAPSMFGSQIFYLQDETGGIQIYLYSSDFPELLVGDVVQVTGELSTSRGERRVKLAGAAGVVPANGSFFSGVQEVSLGDVDESLVGSLIATQGQVQSKDSTKLVIETSGATLTIYLKSNPLIDPNQFERGDQIQVTGVLTTYDGELRLRPRGADDISVTEQAPVATAAMSEPTDGGSSAGLILLFSTMAALGALALWRYMPRRRLTPASA